MFSVLIKSGTSGYHDYDNCDLLVTEIPSRNIPRKGEFLDISDDNNRNYKKYLVTEVLRRYSYDSDDNLREYLKVYVIES